MLQIFDEVASRHVYNVVRSSVLTFLLQIYRWVQFTPESDCGKCWKSVGIWQSCWPEYSGTFFWPTVASCLFFSLCILHLGLVARSSVNLNCRLTQQCRHDNSYSRDTRTNSNDDDDDDCWCVKRLMQKSCTALWRRKSSALIRRSRSWAMDRRDFHARFQALGPAMEKAQCPNLLQQCRGTFSWWRVADRRR